MSSGLGSGVRNRHLRRPRFVTPYTVRKIGVDHFGMWTLVLSLVEYYWLIDHWAPLGSLKVLGPVLRPRASRISWTNW